MEKKKFDDQTLFVLFANAKLEGDVIFDILFGSLGKNSRLMRSRADISKINNYKPNDKNYFEDLKKYIESESTPPQFIPPHNREKEYKDISKIFKNLTGKEFISFPMSRRDLNEVLDNSEYREISITLRFYYAWKRFQLELRHILKNIISNKKLDHYSLSLIDDGYHKNRQKFEISGGKTYLKKITSLEHFELPVACFSNPYLLLREWIMPFVYYKLAEFLCSTHWKTLKQCKECEKFFVARVIRDDIKFCSIKHKQAHWNKEYTKSGKHAEYMRKERPKKPHWIT